MAAQLRVRIHPDGDPAIYAYYRKLFRLRRQAPEFSQGEVLLREAGCDNPHVFTGLRRLGERLTLVMVSLSDKAEKVTVTLPRGLSQGASSWKAVDAFTGDPVKALENRRPTGMTLTLTPCQVVVAR